MEANHEAQGMTFHIHCFGDLYLVAQNRLHQLSTVLHHQTLSCGEYWGLRPAQSYRGYPIGSTAPGLELRASLDAGMACGNARGFRKRAPAAPS
jgi:hypothetical protein